MSDKAARPIDALPTAWSASEDIAARLADHRLAVFLDYDGTLAPIAPHPDLAVIEPETRRAIDELAAQCFVAVVSGRDVEDVREKVGLQSLVYAGSHGFDIAGAGGKQSEQASRDHLAALDALTADLQRKLGGLPGLLLERKRFSLAVHIRQVPAEHHDEVERAVVAALADRPLLRLMRGKKVFEIQPAVNWNKGKAVEWLIRFLNGAASNLLPIYLGDDTTDEDAFVALADQGIGIVVAGAERATHADYRLDDTGEVRAFIEFLVRELDRRGRAGESTPGGGGV